MKYTIKTKKGQMEIIGLAVIVILLALGMFFVTRFTLFGQPTGQAMTSQQKQIATSFVNTLLSSDSDCEGASFTKLIQEMVKGDYSTYRCGEGNEELSVYFERQVTLILSRTLDIWGYNYEFEIDFPDDSDMANKNIIISKGCEDTKEKEAAPPFPIPTDNGVARVILKLCY